MVPGFNSDLQQNDQNITLETDNLAYFLEKIENWRNVWKVNDNAIYRGHTDYNWILIARLFRNPNAKPENLIGDMPDQIEKQLLEDHLKMKDAHNLEYQLFTDFSRYLFAYRPDLICTVPEEVKSNNRAMQEWRQLALAQHYGLPTRFIDFTTNVLVALFFAVVEPVHELIINGQTQEQDSAVWGIEVPNRRKVWHVLEKDGVWLSPLEFAEEGSNPPIANFIDTAFVPEHFDERIRAQGSVFMCEPRGKKISWQLHEQLRMKNTVKNLETGEIKETKIMKVKIPKEMRKSLLKQLDLIGINRATLFPDLESAAKYLTWAIYERNKYYV